MPLSVLYDNDRCLVTRIKSDGTRKRGPPFGGLLSQYAIEDRYGRPGRGTTRAASGLRRLVAAQFHGAAAVSATWDVGRSPPSHLAILSAP